MTRAQWAEALPSEIAFWKGLFEKNSYEPRFVDLFHERIEKDIPFQFEHFVHQEAGSTIRVLDVGAGPLSHVGTISKFNVVVTAIDPLADEYDRLWSDLKKKPRIQTIKGEAEDLDQLFTEKSFDFAYSRNALDHSYDPVLAIGKIISLVKYSIRLVGSVNEGEKGNYEGLHQWNFQPSKEGNDLIVWNKKTSISLKEKFGSLIDINASGDDWFTCNINIKRYPQA